MRGASDYRVVSGADADGSLYSVHRLVDVSKRTKGEIGGAFIVKEILPDKDEYGRARAGGSIGGGRVAGAQKTPRVPQ